MLGVLIVIIPTVEPTYSLQNIEINRKTQREMGIQSRASGHRVVQMN